MFAHLKTGIRVESLEPWLLFVLALAVRLYHLGGPGLWEDEICTAIRINHSLWDTIRFVAHSEFPPLHYIILNLWQSLAGQGEWALRFPSAVFSSLTVAVMYKLGRELFNRAAGRTAGLLLVFSPVAVNYAQDAKMYAMCWFFAAVTFLWWWRFFKTRQDRFYREYIFFSVLSCYTMYTGFLFLAVQGVMVLLREPKLIWRKWFIGQGLVLGFCLPWIIYFLLSWHESWVVRAPHAAFDYGRFFAKTFFLLTGYCYDNWGSINGGLYVFLMLLVVFNLVSFKEKRWVFGLRENDSFVLFWLLAPWVIYGMVDYFFIKAQLQLRYLGFLQVPLLLIVSGQVSRFRPAFKKLFIAVLLAIAVHNTYLYFKENLRYPPEDWRKTALALSQELKPNDLVVSLFWVDLFKYYYKGDTSAFAVVAEKECTTLNLMKNGILKPEAGAVFVLYQDTSAQSLKLEGFDLDKNVSYRGIGWLRFRRHENRGSEPANPLP